MPRCDQCQFFHANPAAGALDAIVVSVDGVRGGGECRRRPPQQSDRETYITFPMARYPIVANDGWCGEFASAATSPRERDVGDTG